MHLLFKCGVRKSELRSIQFRHFDHAQKRLTVFRKGGKVQTLPVVDPAFWNELERWILDWQAQPDEYLLCRRSVRPNPHKSGERFIKATQKLLGRSSISTTADIYVGWDIDQLAETPEELLEGET